MQRLPVFAQAALDFDFARAELGGGEAALEHVAG
jgi:hypothetical protein